MPVLNIFIGKNLLLISLNYCLSTFLFHIIQLKRYRFICVSACRKSFNARWLPSPFGVKCQITGLLLIISVMANILTAPYLTLAHKLKFLSLSNLRDL